MSETDSTEEEHLATGWEPETPVTDTLLRQITSVIAEETTSVVEALGGRVIRNSAVVASDLGRPAAFYNGAILLQPLIADGIEPLMDSLDEFFGAGGPATGMVVLFSPWPTPDLRRFGWKLMGHPPVHVRPVGGGLPPEPPGVDISEVRLVGDLLDWEQGAVRGYFDDLAGLPGGSLAGAALLNDPRHRFWVARVDGEVAGASATMIEHGIVYVSLVATVPEFRGRGIGTALTWRATLADPGLPAALLSSDEGRPLYDKMGYLAITRFTLWYRMRDGQTRRRVDG